MEERKNISITGIITMSIIASIATGGFRREHGFGRTYLDLNLNYVKQIV